MLSEPIDPITRVLRGAHTGKPLYPGSRAVIRSQSGDPSTLWPAVRCWLILQAKGLLLVGVVMVAFIGGYNVGAAILFLWLSLLA